MSILSRIFGKKVSSAAAPTETLNDDRGGYSPLEIRELTPERIRHLFDERYDDEVGRETAAPCANPPYFLLYGTERCWKCKMESPVMALAAFSEEADSVGLVYFTRRMPKTLSRELQRRNGSYRLGESKTAGRYYMNYCESCRAVLGDFFLFCQPGGAFYPDPSKGFAGLEIEPLPFNEAFDVDADFGTHEALDALLRPLVRT